MHLTTLRRLYCLVNNIYFYRWLYLSIWLDCRHIAKHMCCWNHEILIKFKLKIRIRVAKYVHFVHCCFFQNLYCQLLVHFLQCIVYNMIPMPVQVRLSPNHYYPGSGQPEAACNCSARKVQGGPPTGAASEEVCTTAIKCDQIFFHSYQIFFVQRTWEVRCELQVLGARHHHCRLYQLSVKYELLQVQMLLKVQCK